MAFIQLTKDYMAEVDDELFEELNKYSWYASGRGSHVYAARRRYENTGELVYMHNQILGYPKLPRTHHIDHDDDNRLNNKKTNLQIITTKANQQKSPRVKNQKGISIDRTHGTYKAYINSATKRRVNIGTYKTYDEAYEARQKFMRDDHDTIKKED